jgi:DNA-binding NarL/FixJ family response regulator
VTPPIHISAKVFEAMSYKILIIDDSKLARMAAAKALNNLRPDWVRLEASNADEAMATVSREKPDIALLDINMPGRDGLALAGDLAALHSGMPIAIISANIQDEVVARARSIGAAFMPKPLTEAALADFLSDAETRLRRAGR